MLRELSRVALKRKEYLRAGEMAAQGFMIDPGDQHLLFSASYAYKLAGRYDAAVEFGERLRLRDPNHIQNLVNLADCYRLSDNRERAGKLLDEALKIDEADEHAGRLRELLGSEKT